MQQRSSSDKSSQLDTMKKIHRGRYHHAVCIHVHVEYNVHWICNCYCNYQQHAQNQEYHINMQLPTQLRNSVVSVWKFPHSKDLIRAFIFLKDLILYPLRSSPRLEFWVCASIHTDTTHKNKLFLVKNCKATMSFREFLTKQVCKNYLRKQLLD